jgi:hypothetical protein
MILACLSSDPRMHDLFNRADFTPAQHVCYVASTLLWVVAYIQIARDATRYRWLGLPSAALVANLGWELVFSTVVTTRLGAFYVWGARAWLLFDAILFALLLKYGRRQVSNPLLVRHFTAIVTGAIAMWSAGIFAFVKEFHDVIGGFTGYILNVQMSALYVVEIVNHPMQRAYSMRVGVLKMLGTVVILLAELLAPSPSLFVLVLGPITLALDLAYVALIAQRERLAAAVGGAESGSGG